MTKAINIESIEKTTGKLWREWVRELDKNGAKDLPHTELARMVDNMLLGTVKSHAWWAQEIAVAYEQHTGRRAPGQLSNGTYQLAVSKSVPLPRKIIFPRVSDWFESQPNLNGRDYTKPRVSETPKRSNWRCNFADGSKFEATVEDNGLKSRLVLSHTAIPISQEAESWKSFWHKVANKFTKLGDS